MKRQGEEAVRYVSNAGVVFDVGDKKVGIDCLCRDPHQLYQDTPEEIRKGLEVDILIFTHEHGDHFCAEYVKAAWEKNPHLQVYSTETVIEILRKQGIFLENLHSVADGDVVTIKAAAESMQITFAQTLHAGEEYAGVQNFMLLICFGEKRMVISGDAKPCREVFERIAGWSYVVDWMLIPFPYLALRSTRNMISDSVKVRNIFLLHLPEQKADVQNFRERAMKLCESAKDDLPQPVFPERLGEAYFL